MKERLVDRIILPLANFKDLVESEKSKPTKLEKKNLKKIIKLNLNLITLLKRVMRKLEPMQLELRLIEFCTLHLFIMSLDKSNYKFDKKVVRINLFCLKNEIVKSIFGLDNDNLKKATDSKVYFVDCNFTLLEKLTQKYMFNVKVERSITQLKRPKT